MGKRSVAKSTHEMPLDEELTKDRLAKRKKDETEMAVLYDGTKESFDAVDARTTKKILASARKQKEEIDKEMGEPSDNMEFSLKSGDGPESDDEIDEDALKAEAETMWDGLDLEVKAIDVKEEIAINSCIKTNETKRGLTIYDKYLEALASMREQVDDAVSQSQASANGGRPVLDKRIVDVYKGVGEVMSKYRSGKMPKAFKVLPILLDWEQLLFITKPHEWSAAAMYQATKRFAASGTEKVTQRFFNLVLLPRIRDDIGEYKRLNFYLYMALKKALYKIGAFFKGFLLPLCEEGDCTLREAVIISSVLAKCSIPVLHASAAMLKIAEMNYSGANSIFLKTFFCKKYALPFRVIDATVYHFVSFMSDHRQFPALWYQCLLAFVQRYKTNFSKEQKTQLMKLAQKHFHPKITPEIQRELQISINTTTVEEVQPPSDEPMK